MESRVEEDFVLDAVPLEPLEPSDELSVLTLAFERLLKSLKKGIALDKESIKSADSFCSSGARMKGK